LRAGGAPHRLRPVKIQRHVSKPLFRWLCLLGLGLGLSVAQCGAGQASIRCEPFGKTRDRQQVELFTLENAGGLKVKVMTYGAIIYWVETPDRNRHFANITANRPTLADYEAKSPCFGALLGRFANRIAGASFILDGRRYRLSRNSGTNHIHGGFRGFDKRVWHAQALQGRDFVALKLDYTSKDGEEGYPGDLHCTVRYELNNRNELRIEYSATTDKPTPINLSNHAYWNLAGAYSGTVLGQVLTVNASQYLVTDRALIPTGEIAPVAGTPLDFRAPHTIGSRIGEITGEQFGGGYDHCLVLNHKRPGDLAFCAKLEDPKSGRTMEVYTTQPGVQIYSANFPTGAFEGPHGYAYPKHLGLALETEHFPDSPNHPNFPQTILRPGETFRSTTVLRFGVEK
jgi:aldose 1-epimerase